MSDKPPTLDYRTPPEPEPPSAPVAFFQKHHKSIRLAVFVGCLAVFILLRLIRWLGM